MLPVAICNAETAYEVSVGQHHVLLQPGQLLLDGRPLALHGLNLASPLSLPGHVYTGVFGGLQLPCLTAPWGNALLVIQLLNVKAVGAVQHTPSAAPHLPTPAPSPPPLAACPELPLAAPKPIPHEICVLLGLAEWRPVRGERRINSRHQGSMRIALAEDVIGICQTLPRGALVEQDMQRLLDSLHKQFEWTGQATPDPTAGDVKELLVAALSQLVMGMYGVWGQMSSAPRGMLDLLDAWGLRELYDAKCRNSNGLWKKPARPELQKACAAMLASGTSGVLAAATSALLGVSGGVPTAAALPAAHPAREFQSEHAQQMVPLQQGQQQQQPQPQSQQGVPMQSHLAAQGGWALQAHHQQPFQTPPQGQPAQQQPQHPQQEQLQHPCTRVDLEPAFTAAAASGRAQQQDTFLDLLHELFADDEQQMVDSEMALQHVWRAQ